MSSLTTQHRWGPDMALAAPSPQPKAGQEGVSCQCCSNLDSLSVAPNGPTKPPWGEVFSRKKLCTPRVPIHFTHQSEEAPVLLLAEHPQWPAALAREEGPPACMHEHSLHTIPNGGRHNELNRQRRVEARGLASVTRGPAASRTWWSGSPLPAHLSLEAPRHSG